MSVALCGALNIRQPRLFTRDRLMAADRLAVANLTVKVFRAVQEERCRNEVKLLALAAAFSIICKVTRAAIADTFVAIQNLMYDRNHSDRVEHRFAAMEYLLQKDLIAGVPI